jgi:hypothetical protein
VEKKIVHGVGTEKKNLHITIPEKKFPASSKNEIYLQEIYQSSNQEMFAISLSSCSRYNANFKLDQSVSAIHDIRHIFEISEDDHPSLVTHARDN